MGHSGLYGPLVEFDRLLQKTSTFEAVFECPDTYNHVVPIDRPIHLITLPASSHSSLARFARLDDSGNKPSDIVVRGRTDGRMKIASFNVNGITARLPNLLRWLAETRPDVACLQELKVPHDKFPEAAIREGGYGVIWHGQKSFNGVAILARGADPVEVRRVLPGDPDDLDSRYIEGQAGGVLVGCLYLPNGNPAPGRKFDYKLQWLNRLAKHAETLIALNSPVVLAGDYNVIPTELDVFAPERWVDDALFRPESREAFARLLARGWTDALRRMHPEERIYTFWDYFRNHFGRDRGLRIDHLLLSPSLAPRLVGVGVDRQVRGWEKASDHAPTWVQIAD